jgi:hypothetical protein
LWIHCGGLSENFFKMHRPVRGSVVHIDLDEMNGEKTYIKDWKTFIHQKFADFDHPTLCFTHGSSEMRIFHHLDSLQLCAFSHVRDFIVAGFLETSSDTVNHVVERDVPGFLTEQWEK